MPFYAFGTKRHSKGRWTTRFGGGQYFNSPKALCKNSFWRSGYIPWQTINLSRARPFNYQKLGAEYYQIEHIKPIFGQLEILTFQGLFKYHCICEIFKIIQSSCPYSLNQSITISKRDTSHVIILTKKSNAFLYKTSPLWNSIHKKMISPEKGLSTSVGLFKLKAKAPLLQAQSSEIHDQWTLHKFQSPLLTPVLQPQNTNTNDHFELITQNV